MVDRLRDFPTTIVLSFHVAPRAQRTQRSRAAQRQATRVKSRAAAACDRRETQHESQKQTTLPTPIAVRTTLLNTTA